MGKAKLIKVLFHIVFEGIGCWILGADRFGRRRPGGHEVKYSQVYSFRESGGWHQLEASEVAKQLHFVFCIGGGNSEVSK